MVHSEVRLFSSDAYGKAFTNGTYLNTYQLVHAENKPYSCNVCGSNFLEMKASKDLLDYTLENDHILVTFARRN